MRLLASARRAGSVPSIPMRTRRETTPSRNWSTRICCSGVGERGRKADTSLVISVRAMTIAQTVTQTSHTPIAPRGLIPSTSSRALLELCERHHGAVAFGFRDLDRAHRRAASGEAYLIHHAGNAGFARLE